MKYFRKALSFIVIGIIASIILAGIRFLIFTFLEFLKVLWIAFKLVCKTTIEILYILSRIIAWPFKNCFPAKSIDQMSGLEFEEFCSKWLAREGYRGIKRTPNSADYGVDIITNMNNQKFGVQCKRYSGNVGVGAIQEISAGLPFYDCDRGIVITNSEFTKNAIELALANDILLIDGKMLKKTRSCKSLTRNKTAMIFSVIIMSAFTLLSMLLLILSLISYRSFIPLTIMLFGICSLTLLNGILELRFKNKQKEDLNTDSESEEIWST